MPRRTRGGRMGPLTVVVIKLRARLLADGLVYMEPSSAPSRYAQFAKRNIRCRREIFCSLDK